MMNYILYNHANSCAYLCISMLVLHNLMYVSFLYPIAPVLTLISNLDSYTSDDRQKIRIAAIEPK
ncbi:hypothetical protein BGW36DRAFT_370171 [Talaromyces proteolyticus]|uniref:Uncharacterized protein n=1 Tax=Talaromyces proteolyticus TaxID=1131652 RepID=A0AAD4Q575_9EURO|nr:uncharacterized protein BGW36DRAFT_370171 [Talaromyces proteolyticus]KAH8703879.1 hypothetical protein BGW36DRAFT_370171 [Talaromyces proteolyticus]